MAISTWIADGAHGNLASTAANWDAAPTTSSDILFNNASVVNCTFDLTGSYGALTIAATPGAGYSGTFTQAASFSITSYSQAAGTFTGSASYVLTDSGNFAQTAGTLTSNVLRLRMTGDGTSIIATVTYIFGLQISANVTLSPTGQIAIMHTGATFLIIDFGKILTISGGSRLAYVPTAISTYTNNGTIDGLGEMWFKLYQVDSTITFGTINCLVTIKKTSDVTGNRILTLDANAIFGYTLVINSDHATLTATLDLSASNYALSCTDLIIGTRGILNGRESRIIGSSLSMTDASSVFTQGGYCRIAGAASISNGTWSVNAVARVASLSQSGGAITVASGMILYYDSTASLTGGTRSGVIDRWPFPSEKSDDAVPFETPKAGARF